MVVIHGTVQASSPKALVEAVRRSVNMHPVHAATARNWINESLPTDSSVLPANRQSAQVVLVTAAASLERLYSDPEYKQWETVDQWLWALNHSTHVQPDPHFYATFLPRLLRPSAAQRIYVGHQGLTSVVVASGEGASAEFSYSEFTLRTLFADAVILGSLQRIVVGELETEVYSLLRGLTTSSLRATQDHLLSFRSDYWAVGFGYSGPADQILRGYQESWRLSPRLADLVSHLGQYSLQLQTRATDNMNNILLFLSVYGVPASLVVAVWAAGNRDWLSLVFPLLGVAWFGSALWLIRTVSSRPSEPHQ